MQEFPEVELVLCVRRSLPPHKVDGPYKIKEELICTRRSLSWRSFRYIGSSSADQVLLVKFPSESQALVYGFATFHCASCNGSIYIRYLLFDSVATLYTQLPDMSQNSAAHLARVEHAVKTLLKAHNLTVPEAMYLAKFLEEDIANESIRRRIRRRLPGGTKKI